MCAHSHLSNQFPILSKIGNVLYKLILTNKLIMFLPHFHAYIVHVTIKTTHPQKIIFTEKPWIHLPIPLPSFIVYVYERNLMFSGPPHRPHSQPLNAYVFAEKLMNETGVCAVLNRSRYIYNKVFFLYPPEKSINFIWFREQSKTDKPHMFFCLI